jgi:hypothetical protein
MASNPWDVAPLADQGDDDAIGIHQAVGLALTHWSQIETFLAKLFAMLVGSRFESAEAAYSHIQNVGTRNVMIREAAKRVMVPTSPLNDELNTLLDQIGKLSGRRNDIAHGTSTGFHGFKHGGVFLAPEAMDFRKYSFHPLYRPQPSRPAPYDQFAYAYTSGQIVGYAITFQSYAMKVIDLMKRIEQHYAVRLKPQK